MHLDMYRMSALPVRIHSCMFVLQQVSYTTKIAFLIRGFSYRNQNFILYTCTVYAQSVCSTCAYLFLYVSTATG